MKDHTKNLHSNTVAFACLEPQVATLILDVIQALASVLRWRQVSKSLLIEILSRLAELPSFEQAHNDFSAALWPNLDDKVRAEKLSKWLKKLKEDIELSNCPSVRIVSKRPQKSESGEWKNLPTLYLPGNFWLLFRAVQDAAMKCDLLREEDVRKRRAKVRAIVAQWLNDAGAIPIDWQKKIEEIKPAKPSLPCSCACPNCQKCAAKPATESEAAGASEPVLSVQIENEKKRLLQMEEELVMIGTRMLNRGTKLSIVDNRLDAVSKVARVQLKTAVARNAGRGADYAPNTQARAHGRAGQELVIEGLNEMIRAAEEIGKTKHVERLREIRAGMEAWKLFSNRNGITMEGGQPK